MEINITKQTRCKECNSIVSMTGQGCFMCFTCKKLVDVYINEVKWILLMQVLRRLEEHKFCQEYHKIPSKDNPKEYYKESCLFVIWKEITDSLDALTSNSEPKGSTQNTG